MKLFIEQRHFRTIVEEDENIDTPEKIHRELVKITDNLGYDYKESSVNSYGKGIIYIANDLKIVIRYNTKINELYVAVGDSDKRAMYNCTDVSSSIDNLSVNLQTASMICDEIRQKIRY